MGRSRCRKIRRNARRLASLLCCCTSGARRTADQGHIADCGPVNSHQHPEEVEVSNGESVIQSPAPSQQDTCTDTEMADIVSAEEGPVTLSTDDSNAESDGRDETTLCGPEPADAESDSDQSDVSCEDIEVAHVIREEKTAEEEPSVAGYETVTEEIDNGKYDDDDDKCGPVVGDIDATLTHAILELCPENTDLVCGGKKVVLTDDSEVKNDGYGLSNSSLTEKMADEFEKVASEVSGESETASAGEGVEQPLMEEGSLAERVSELTSITLSEPLIPTEQNMAGPEVSEMEKKVKDVAGADGTLRQCVRVYIAKLMDRVVDQVYKEESTIQSDGVTNLSQLPTHSQLSNTQCDERASDYDGRDNSDRNDKVVAVASGCSTREMGTQTPECVASESGNSESEGGKSGGVFEVKLVSGLLGLGLTLGLGEQQDSVIIQNIGRFSTAAAHGELRVGQCVLGINGSSISGEGLSRAQEMLCRTKWGEEVKILVGPPQKRVELVLPHHETVVFRGSQSSNAGVIIMKLNTSRDRPLGVEIEGGSDTDTAYVKISAITPGSIAETCGLLQVGDELVEVDHQPMVGITHTKAVGIVRNINRPVTITLQRREGFDLEARISRSRHFVTRPLSCF